MGAPPSVAPKSRAAAWLLGLGRPRRSSCNRASFSSACSKPAHGADLAGELEAAPADTALRERRNPEAEPGLLGSAVAARDGREPASLKNSGLGCRGPPLEPSNDAMAIKNAMAHMLP